MRCGVVIKARVNPTGASFSFHSATTACAVAGYSLLIGRFSRTTGAVSTACAVSKRFFAERVFVFPVLEEKSAAAVTADTASLSGLSPGVGIGFGVGTGTGAGAEAAQQGGLMGMLFPLAIFVLIFYFFIIRPQKKRDKQQKNMIDSISRGDQIITIGGFYGTVREVRDDSFQIEIAEGVRVTILKSAVQGKRNTSSANTAKSEASAS